MSFPGHGSTTQTTRAPGSTERLPAVDEHVVRPESGEEMLDGVVRIVMGASPPHAIANSDLATLLTTHAAAGYRAAVDLLTRADHENNFAPDASVFPADEDPATGGRKIECLAFEITATQTRADAARKAALLHARGVERVFCVDVNEYEVLEWSPPSAEAPGSSVRAWRRLDLDTTIEHACLVRPLAVSALLDAAERDDESAKALLVKRPPSLVRALGTQRAEGLREGEAKGEAKGLREGEARGKAEGLREGKAKGLREGEAKGLREAVRTVCELIGIELDEARERELAALDEAALRTLLAHLKTARAWP